MISEKGFTTPVPLKKRSFSTVSNLITGCDDFDLTEEFNATSNLSSSHPLPDLEELSDLHSDLKSAKRVSRPMLYERRGSALFDLAKSKSSQRIKRRRNGITAMNKSLLIPEEQEPLQNASEKESMHFSVSSSSHSSVSTEYVETIDESPDRQRSPTGCDASNQRDSGVSLAFDNVVYTNNEEKDRVVL